MEDLLKRSRNVPGSRKNAQKQSEIQQQAEAHVKMLLRPVLFYQNDEENRQKYPIKTGILYYGCRFMKNCACCKKEIGMQQIVL